MTWTGPRRSTTVGDVRDNWDHFYLTLGSAGDFKVKITWESVTDDFNLFVYRGHIDPDQFAPPEAVVGQSINKATTSEQVVVSDAGKGEYTIRVVYLAVVDSESKQGRYNGQAVFLDGRVLHDASDLEFGPATIVSAHFLGTEPMLTMERPIPGSLPGAIDSARIFVDWPLTSRGQIGQVSRSLDGGESFRLLFDPACAARSRPGCLMGGGSDTITEVDLIDGTLYFSDQAVIVGTESLASSTNHGDTFPEARQFTITSQTTVTDRQWLAPTNGVPIDVGPREIKREIRAFLAYHVPFEGQYIHGIDQDGRPIPQPAPQLTNVVQSGFLRVDTSHGPGRGYIYQPYLDFGTEGLAVKVATARGPDYQLRSGWAGTTVTGDSITHFPWLDIDAEGNAYLVWVGEGAVNYSVSPISNEANNPNMGGRPGTFWTPQLRLNPPDIQSAVFAEVVAGDRGRIAVTYLGAEDFSGIPDDALAGVDWHAYASVVTNALGEGGPPEVTTGRVSHRVVHRGQICTAGLFCTAENGDRSLADMIDIGVDQDGRIGVVFADNNNSLPMQNDSEQARPFAHFAKLSAGPSLFENKPAIASPVPVDGTDMAEDSTWPNTAKGAYLPALDVRGATLSLEGDEVVARIDLASAAQDQMRRDFASFAASPTTGLPPERLHYMLRFSTADDVYHLSMESPAGATRRFFGGRLDDNDALRAGDSLVGSGYHTDPMTVTGSVEGNTLVIRGKAADFGVVDGTAVFSVTGFTMAGPTERNEAIVNPMRTIDATPPFDATLASASVTPSPTPSVSPSASLSPTPTVSPSPQSIPASVVLTPAEATSDPGTIHEVTALVTDATGAPVPDATVEWSSTGVGDISSHESTTDEDGLARAVLSSEERGDQLVTVSSASCADGGTCSATAVAHWGPARCDIFGTAGNDFIQGTGAGEVICGFGGADVILGRGGNDIILGRGGSDRLFGGRGADVIKGHRGGDELRGGPGGDRVRGGRGNDLLFGGSGPDHLRGGPGADTLDGGPGRDFCRPGRGRDEMRRCE